MGIYEGPMRSISFGESSTGVMLLLLLGDLLEPYGPGHHPHILSIIQVKLPANPFELPDPLHPSLVSLVLDLFASRTRRSLATLSTTTPSFSSRSLTTQPSDFASFSQSPSHLTSRLRSRPQRSQQHHLFIFLTTRPGFQRLGINHYQTCIRSTFLMTVVSR